MTLIVQTTQEKHHQFIFLHFKFEDHHVKDFKDMDCTVEIGTDHEQYPHISVLTNEIKTALIKDFD